MGSRSEEGRVAITFRHVALVDGNRLPAAQFPAGLYFVEMEFLNVGSAGSQAHDMRFVARDAAGDPIASTASGGTVMAIDFTPAPMVRGPGPIGDPSDTMVRSGRFWGPFGFAAEPKCIEIVAITLGDSQTIQGDAIARTTRGATGNLCPVRR